MTPLKQLLRYLFPRPRPRDRLPLLPTEWSNERPAPMGPSHRVHLVKAYGLARTDQDARRLLQRYRGQPINEIVKAERRIRRREPRLKRAWRRFKRLW